MIVKILSSASNDFHGVKYNDKKMESGAGELMTMENLPDGFDENPKQEAVRNYFKSISKSEKVKKPKFHATISTKFQNHSKEELTEIGQNFMQEMGYGEQPYIIVFHNDTENNHIHIVSTRVDKSTGKKIDDSFEKLKSQRALQKVLAQLHGEQLDKDLEKLLRYRYGTTKQLVLLLERSGFKMVQNKTDDTAFDILKNGVKQKTLEAVGIITIVGQSFITQYRAVYRSREMYNTQSNIQIQPEDMQPLEFPKMKLSNMELRKLAMEIITKKAKKPLREVNNLKLTMKLNNVYVMSDYIFLDISFENKTHLSYDIEGIKYSIEDKKIYKATNNQSIELKPVYQLHKPTHFKRSFRNIYIFKKFTYPNSKVMKIRLLEEQLSGRTIEMKIKYSDILNADTF